MAEAVDATTGILDVERRCDSSSAYRRHTALALVRYLDRWLRTGTHLTELFSLDEPVASVIALPADGGREETDERLEDLELDLDTLRDYLLERLENLFHQALWSDSRSVSAMPLVHGSPTRPTLGTAPAAMSRCKLETARAMIFELRVAVARKIGWKSGWGDGGGSVDASSY